MTAPIVAACVWVVAATAVAFLPMRVQRILGLPLVAAALALIIWLSRAVSHWIGVAALARLCGHADVGHGPVRPMDPTGPRDEFLDNGEGT